MKKIKINKQQKRKKAGDFTRSCQNFVKLKNHLPELEIKHGKQSHNVCPFSIKIPYFFLFNLQAVLGVQIVITMVMASVMSKIGPFMSLARWLLTSTGKVS